MNETKFEVSINQFDHILMLSSGIHGVWLSVRGSSIVHLFDRNTFKRKFLLDVRTNQKLNCERDDDFSFNFSRLTSILSIGGLVWLGTGDGYLYIYSVKSKIKIKSRSESMKVNIQSKLKLRQTNSLNTPFLNQSKNTAIKKHVVFSKNNLSLDHIATHKISDKSQLDGLDIIKAYLTSLPSQSRLSKLSMPNLRARNSSLNNTESFEEEEDNLNDDYISDDLWSGSSRLSYSTKHLNSIFPSSSSSSSLQDFHAQQTRKIKSKTAPVAIFGLESFKHKKTNSEDSESTVVFDNASLRNQSQLKFDRNLIGTSKILLNLIFTLFH